ncbi:MAG: radical SAM protein [Candidatus Stahlbacteria bacterium]|nr:radical SAM protein [Candidatus Stahlbacteria bacterium]
MLLVDFRNRKFYLNKSILLYKVIKMLEKKYHKEKIIHILSNEVGISPLKVKLKIEALFKEISEMLLNDKNSKSFTVAPTDAPIDWSCLTSPLGISLLLTYQCNLKCKHCLVGSFRDLQILGLNVEDINRLAEQMETQEILKISLNGGEPMMKEDFSRILEIFYLHNILIELSTNGVLLNRENIQLMNNFHVLTYILSLEGSNSKTNDFIRGDGTFRKIINSISNIKKSSSFSEVEVEVTYGKHNLKEIEEIVVLLENLGVSRVQFARLRPWNYGNNLQHFIPSKKDIMYLNKKTIELHQKYNITVDGDIPISKPLGCNLILGFEILPNGDVLPCRIFEQCNNKKAVLLGNIKKKKLTTIWQSKKAQRIRSITYKLAEKKPCDLCGNFSNFCATNYCIVENYLKFGKFIPSVDQLKKCEMHVEI